MPDLSDMAVEYGDILPALQAGLYLRIIISKSTDPYNNMSEWSDGRES